MDSEHRDDAKALGRRRAVVSLALGLAVGGTVLAAWLSTRRSANGPVTESADGERTAVVETDYEPPSDEGYVGSATCAACHAEIAESYKTHPMSRSIRRIDPTSPAASLPQEETRVEGTQWVYEVEVRDGAMRHHEMMFDAQGELIYDQAVPVDYVVGSGQRAKAYLHQRGELLFMSPLNWYSQPARWDLAPGYARDDVRRFDRRITDDCLSCHAGRVAPVGRSLHRYEDPAFHELAIGCENCHGPGEQHVALHQSASSIGGDDDPIVNPARLDPARRESVCNQCHLQAAVRLPRLGRSDFDFRPGLRFDEIWTVLDTGSSVAEDGRTKAVSHVQQMRASRCYTESAGRLGCISCHDPHRVPSEAERVAFYREKCFVCHSDSSCFLPHKRRLEQGNSCIACHMPARDASNISHVTQTDHRIIRLLEDAADDGAGHESDALTFFDEQDRRLEEWERDRALGLGAWLHLSKTGRRPSQDLAQFLARLLDRIPNDGAILTVLGAFALDNQHIERARGYYDRARDIPAAEEAALDGLLKVHYFSSEWEQALKCADRLIEIDPGNARAHAMRADVLKALERNPEGIESARRALEFNPTLVPVRQWLVEVYRRTGRDKERREQERILRRMRDARPPR